MDSLTTIQAPNTTANEHHSEKFGWDGTNSQLSVPPQAAVRTRSINEGIEMRVLARSGSVGDPTLLEDDDHDTSESETSSRKEWIVVIVCGLCLFLSGWQDGSLGPLIPTIQNYYGLTFTSVSVLFISGCAGFLLAAGLNNGDNLAIGGVFQAVAYAVLVPALPFPVMAVAFVVKGFAGIGLQDALANGLVTALRNNPSEKLGIIHAFYGEYSRFTLPH
ncbi:MFS general substrate transporter, partial [Rhizoctonia solani]